MTHTAVYDKLNRYNPLFIKYHLKGSSSIIQPQVLVNFSSTKIMRIVFYLTCMEPSMVFQVSCGCECLTTRGTYKGTGIRVGSLMDVQLLDGLEHFTTLITYMVLLSTVIQN